MCVYVFRNHIILYLILLFYCTEEYCKLPLPVSILMIKTTFKSKHAVQRGNKLIILQKLCKTIHFMHINIILHPTINK